MGMIYYKIRSKENGNFRCAGGEPKWNKSGKVFDSLGKLRLMISNCMRHNNYNHYKNDFNDWEIIEYEVTEKSVKDMHEIIDPKKVWNMIKK